MNEAHPLHVLIGALALGALVFFGLGSNGPEPQVVTADVSHNLSGWGWSDTTGWISFNCTSDADVSCADTDYGVNIDPNTGDFSGHAWSDHAGWISFERSETGNPPNPAGTTDPGSGSGPIAQLGEDGTVYGWARALAACENIPCTNVTPPTPVVLASSAGIIDNDTFSMNIGTAGTDRVVAIFAATNDENATVQGVTVDSNSCNFAAQSTQNRFSGIRIELWYCDEDDLGASTGTVDVIVDGTGTADLWSASAVLLTGADQAGPIDTATAIDQSNDRISITNLTFDDGAAILGAAAHNEENNDWNSYSTELTEQQEGGGDGSGIRMGTAAGTESAGATNKSYYFDSGDNNYSYAAAVGAAWNSSSAGSSDGGVGPGPNAGGWDGWISFSEDGRSEPVRLEGNRLVGFAWGSNVVGWLTVSEAIATHGNPDSDCLPSDIDPDPNSNDADGDGVLDGNEDPDGNGITACEEYVADDEPVVIGGGALSQILLGLNKYPADLDIDLNNNSVRDAIEGICSVSHTSANTITDITWTVNESLIFGGTGSYTYEWTIPGLNPPPGNGPVVTGRLPIGTHTTSVKIISGPLAVTVPCLNPDLGTTVTIVSPTPEFDVVATPTRHTRQINITPVSAIFTVSVTGVSDLDGGPVTLTPGLPAALANPGDVTISPSSATISSPYSDTIQFTITVNNDDNSLKGEHQLTFTGSATVEDVTETDTAIVTLDLQKTRFEER